MSDVIGWVVALVAALIAGAAGHGWWSERRRARGRRDDRELAAEAAERERERADAELGRIREEVDADADAGDLGDAVDRLRSTDGR